MQHAVIILAIYLAFGAMLGAMMIYVMPLIERGKFDRIYPASVRPRARRNAALMMDLIDTAPGGHGQFMALMSIAWPYVVFGPR